MRRIATTMCGLAALAAGVARVRRKHESTDVGSQATGLDLLEPRAAGRLAADLFGRGRR